MRTFTTSFVFAAAITLLATALLATATHAAAHKPAAAPAGPSLERRGIWKMAKYGLAATGAVYAGKKISDHRRNVREERRQAEANQEELEQLRAEREELAQLRAERNQAARRPRVVVSSVRQRQPRVTVVQDDGEDMDVDEPRAAPRRVTVVQDDGEDMDVDGDEPQTGADDEEVVDADDEEPRTLPMTRPSPQRPRVATRRVTRVTVRHAQ